jgi:hypothetical protein
MGKRRFWEFDIPEFTLATTTPTLKKRIPEATPGDRVSIGVFGGFVLSQNLETGSTEWVRACATVGCPRPQNHNTKSIHCIECARLPNVVVLYDPTCSNRKCIAKSLCRNCLRRKEYARKFADLVKLRGGKQIGVYIDSKTPIECKCSQGHTCKPSYSNLTRGKGMRCATCAGMNLEVAEASFRVIIESGGGKVLGTYQNRLTPVDCKCAKGHSCSPTPHSAQTNQEWCSECIPNSVSSGKKRFEEVSRNSEEH